MWWARGLFLATGVALLALVLHEADLHTAAAAVAAFGVPALLAVVALYGVEFLADTASWHLAMPSIAFNAGWLRQLFVTRLVGEAVNAVTPLAGMGGEPVKAWFLKRRHAIEYGESAASLVIARTVNLLALLPFLAIGAMLAAADSQLFGAYGVAAGLGFVALAAATLAFFAVQRLRIASSLARLCRQPPRSRAPMQRPGSRADRAAGSAPVSAGVWPNRSPGSMHSTTGWRIFIRGAKNGSPSHWRSRS